MGSILAEISVIDFDLGCAREHAKLWAEMEQNGNKIGPHDMIIGATCLHYGHSIATLNEREFIRINQLVLANARKYIV